MRPDESKLAFLALCVLDEAIHQAHSGFVAASPALRLALGYLYATGDRRKEHFDREPYDAFWIAATQSDEHGGSAEAFGRSQIFTSSFNGIARAAGFTTGAALSGQMRIARGCPLDSDRQASRT